MHWAPHFRAVSCAHEAPCESRTPANPLGILSDKGGRGFQLYFFQNSHVFKKMKDKLADTENVRGEGGTGC